MGTKMELSRPLSSGGDSSYTLTFNELTGFVTVPANGSVYLPLDAGVHRYEIKTVYAKPDKAVKVRVELKDRETNGFTYYSTLEQSEVHDIVNVPASDKSGKKRVHAFISNAGGETTTIQVIIKIIPMSGGN